MREFTRSHVMAARTLSFVMIPGRRRWTQIVALLLAVPLLWFFILAPIPPLQTQPVMEDQQQHIETEAQHAQPRAAAADDARADTLVFPGASPRYLHGRVGLHADGTPGWTLNPWLDHDETMAEKRLHHTQNCFNLRRSDSISLDRDTPDVRHTLCRAMKYPHDLPQTSVVFVFFNEPLSPLFRSIHSVLNRSPPHLLKEIILVDDGSTAPWLQAPLEDYLKLLPAKIKLVRMPVRQGLMATRTEGARHATAATVTFLDSHIECTEGWLEPLLHRIHQDRRHVVMPIIDSIDADSFEYHAGGIDILGHSWSLGQKGVSRTKSKTEAMRSPVMAGGLFSMDRALFFELGGYDPGMALYGGEEMEIAFRIWQCGNTLECMPCSSVGHIFRTGAFWQGQVYPVPGEIIIKNKMRAAAVWLDEYQGMVGNRNTALPDGLKIDAPIDLSHMTNIRNTCLNGGPSHSFKWYLQNIYPEIFDPLDTKIVAYHGEIRNRETDGCLDTLGAHSGGANVGLYPCHGKSGTQDFLVGTSGEIRVGAGEDFTSCLEIHGAALRSMRCTLSDAQRFTRSEEDGMFVNKNTGLCLQALRESNDKSPFALKTAPCNRSEPLMKFVFQPEGYVGKRP